MIISQVGVGHYYIDSGGRVFRVQAEQLRPVSEREHLAQQAVRNAHRAIAPIDTDALQQEERELFGDELPAGPEQQQLPPDVPIKQEPVDQEHPLADHGHGHDQEVPGPHPEHLLPKREDPGGHDQELPQPQHPPRQRFPLEREDRYPDDMQVKQEPTDMDEDMKVDEAPLQSEQHEVPEQREVQEQPEPQPQQEREQPAQQQRPPRQRPPQGPPQEPSFQPLRRSARIRDRQQQQAGPYFATWEPEQCIEIMLNTIAEMPSNYLSENDNAEIFMATPSTKRRTEVSMRDLSREDRELFNEAKAKEWQSWLSKEAVELVRNKLKIPRNQILKARWVLTWKKTGEAKARLCVLGFQDPRLETVQTSSPTMTQDAEHLVLQWIVNNGHKLESGDLKTAFLSGDSDPDLPLYIQPPADLANWLKLGPDEQIKLRKAVYGLVDAPRRWHLRLARELRNAGFVPIRTDECVWILPTDKKDGTRHIHGILGVHVDDLIGGGDARWQQAVMKLRTSLEFGSWETSNFVFRGRHLQQSLDRSCIEITMKDYALGLKPITVPRENRNNPDTPVSNALHTEFRGLVGGLQWLCGQGSPGLSYDVNLLQSRSASPNTHDLLRANKILRTAWSMKEVTLRIIKLPRPFTWITLTDAAHANRPDLSSTSGHLVFGAHPNIMNGQTVPISLLGWSSRKIRRKVRSSLGAEASAMSTGLEHTDLLRVMYGEMCGDIKSLSDHEAYLRETPALVLSDCKSLADALNNTGCAASKTSEDKRLAIELSMIKQRLEDQETSFQWVDAVYMLSDVLTKGLERGRWDILEKALRTSRYSIRPTEDMLQDRAKKRAEKQG